MLPCLPASLYVGGSVNEHVNIQGHLPLITDIINEFRGFTNRKYKKAFVFVVHFVQNYTIPYIFRAEQSFYSSLPTLCIFLSKYIEASASFRHFSKILCASSSESLGYSICTPVLTPTTYSLSSSSTF